jgi:hypothetical protein
MGPAAIRHTGPGGLSGTVFSSRHFSMKGAADMTTMTMIQRPHDIARFHDALLGALLWRV